MKKYIITLALVLCSYTLFGMNPRRRLFVEENVPSAKEPQGGYLFPAIQYHQPFIVNNNEAPVGLPKPNWDNWDNNNIAPINLPTPKSNKREGDSCPQTPRAQRTRNNGNNDN